MRYAVAQNFNHDPTAAGSQKLLTETYLLILTGAGGIGSRCTVSAGSLPPDLLKMLSLQPGILSPKVLQQQGRPKGQVYSFAGVDPISHDICTSVQRF